MSNEIIKILDDLGQRFGITIDWSSQNVIPYLQDLMQRFINYEVISSIVWIFISFVVLYGAYIGIPRFNKYADKKIEENKYGESDWEWGRIIINIVCGILIIGFVFCVMEQIFDIVTCYTIPEKMIVDYLTMLMGSE